MNKAKEISALWEQIKPQIGELVGLCCEVEDHAEVTADAYQRGYETAKHECEDCRKIRADAEQELADKAYQRGYKAGLNDAWECARKIVSIPTAELHTMFDKAVYYDTVFRDCTASEAIEKIRQYEQEKEEQIQVGDEVTFLPNNAKGIVTECHVPDVYSDNDKYAVWCGGTMEYVLKQHLTKTGRTFPEIAEVIAKMKES